MKCLLILSLCLSLSPSLVRADSARLLDTDRDALLARVEHLLRKNRKQIDIAAFIIEDDRGGQALLALVRKALRNGVKIRLLYDAVGSRVNPAVLQALMKEGLEVRVFNELPKPKDLLKPRQFFQKLNRRMHDKLFLFDDNAMITGGRNIGGTYLMHLRARLRRGKQQFRDKDILLEGSEGVTAARAYFNELWASPEVTPYRKAPVAPAKLAKAQGLLDQLELDLEHLTHQKTWRGEWRELPPGAVSFVHNTLDPGKGNPGVAHRLLEMINSAKEEILIENPYVIPPKEFKEALKAAVDRGVKVTIYTNPSRKTDSGLAGAAYANDKRELLEMGVGLRELDSYRMLHSKMFLADGREMFIGTYNLDPRSQNLNLESGVMIKDEGFVQQVRDNVQRTDFLSKPASTTGPCPTLFMRLPALLLRDLL